MPPIAGCSKLRRIVLAIAASSSIGCTTQGSDGAACPPVAAYPAALRERAVAEVGALPPGSAVEVMLADYAVLRAQARTCAESQVGLGRDGG